MNRIQPKTNTQFIIGSAQRKISREVLRNGAQSAAPIAVVTGGIEYCEVGKTDQVRNA